MIRTFNHKTSISFSFSEKISLLQKVKETNFEAALDQLINGNSHLAPMYREALKQLVKTHCLVEDGLVEKSMSGAFQYTHNNCPKQPNVLFPPFMRTLSENKKQVLQAAMIHLNTLGSIKTETKKYNLASKTS